METSIVGATLAVALVSYHNDQALSRGMETSIVGATLAVALATASYLMEWKLTWNGNEGYVDGGSG